MSDLITTVRQATPARVTRSLRQAGALPEGRAVRVRVVDSRPSPGGRVARLEVEYSPGAPEAAPRKLFLKLGYGRAEAALYQAVGTGDPGLPMVRCYDAAYETESDRCHLLLDDATETHGMASVWPLPPARRDAEAIVDCLARLHAHWWESPRLGEEVADLPHYLSSEEAYQGTHQWLKDVTAEYAERLGDCLPGDWLETYQQALAAWPRLWSVYWQPKLASRRGLTLIHGDAHPGNVLFPRDRELGRICLVDWQGYHIGVGTRDVAYLLSCHWHPRPEYARPYLMRYWESLKKYGVTDYSQEAFWLDYRVSIMNYLFDAPRLYQMGAGADLWWYIFERTLTAYREWRCEEAVVGQ